MLRRRATATVQRLGPFISDGGTILDIGGGTGLIAEQILKQTGNNVTLIDVEDRRLVPLPMILSSAEFLPVGDRSFDFTLLLTMLHHTRHPSEAISEARRVSRRSVIVQEDLYEGGMNDAVLHHADRLISCATRRPLPAARRAPEQWEELFKTFRHGA